MSYSPTAPLLALTNGLPPAVVGPPLNVYRVCLHPDGLASRTSNFGEWADYLLRQLRRTIVLTADPALERLLDELTAYPDVAAVATAPHSASWDEPPLLVPLRLAVGDDDELSLFTTLTTFGTPRDVTLDELAIELFFPADDHSDDTAEGDCDGDDRLRKRRDAAHRHLGRARGHECDLESTGGGDASRCEV